MIKYYFFLFCIAFIFSNNLYSQSLPEYKLYLCEDNIKESSITDIFFIKDSSNDTIVATKLLYNDTVSLRCDIEYQVYFISRKKWKYISGISIDSNNRDRALTLCIDFSKKYKKNLRNYNLSITNGYTIWNMFTLRYRKCK